MAKKRVRLTFPEELIKEPVIYNLGINFNIVTNVRRANVERQVGWVILEIDGSDEDLKKGLAYLNEVGVQVDLLEGDVIES
ncbi:MAG TPA: FeS-binding protein [Actinobacteria bacterium]|nr:FeS-binding protein [Actinomycetes bacterium]HEX21360.1 FeS-binding protein [Actinomycetota bacterium]